MAALLIRGRNIGECMKFKLDDAQEPQNLQVEKDSCAAQL
jgi:hypothetical protein